MAVLAPFDHKREFEVRRKGFVYAGHAYKVGEAFNKIDVAPRKLEMLYNGRFIGFVDDVTPVKAPVYVPRVAIVADVTEEKDIELSDQDRIDILVGAHTKAALIEMAAAADIKVDRVSPKAVIAAAIVQADADGSA